MNRIVAVFCRTLLACTIILATGGTSYAGVREEAERLRAATQIWSPLNFNNDVIAYIDPYSIFKVNEKDWDINVSSVNNANQYIPEDTITYRIDCENLKVQKQGWRVGGQLKEYKGPLGVWVMNPTRSDLRSGSIIGTAKEFVCGNYVYGSRYYYVYSSFRNNQLRSTLDQVWIKENTVFVSPDDRNIRKANMMTTIVGNLQGNVFDIYANCYQRKWLPAENGQATADWGSVPSGSGLEVIFDRICSNKFAFMSYQSAPITLPLPKLVANPQNNQDRPQSTETSIEDAKRKCSALGFTAGTQKFGQCVLQISK